MARFAYSVPFSIHFTKHTLLSLMRKGDLITIKDTMFLGLKFRVGQKRSVFLFEKRIAEKRGMSRGAGTGVSAKASPAVTFTIGAFPAISIEEARREALRLAGLCEQGIDPRMEKRNRASRSSSSRSSSESSIPSSSPEVGVLFSEAVQKFLEMKAGLSPKSLRLVNAHQNCTRLYSEKWYHRIDNLLLRLKCEVT